MDITTLHYSFEEKPTIVFQYKGEKWVVNGCQCFKESDFDEKIEDFDIEEPHITETRNALNRDFVDITMEQVFMLVNDSCHLNKFQCPDITNFLLDNKTNNVTISELYWVSDQELADKIIKSFFTNVVPLNSSTATTRRSYVSSFFSLIRNMNDSVDNSNIVDNVFFKALYKEMKLEMITHVFDNNYTGDLFDDCFVEVEDVLTILSFKGDCSNIINKIMEKHSNDENVIESIQEIIEKYTTMVNLIEIIDDEYRHLFIYEVRHLRMFLPEFKKAYRGLHRRVFHDGLLIQLFKQFPIELVELCSELISRFPAETLKEVFLSGTSEVFDIFNTLSKTTGLFGILEDDRRILDTLLNEISNMDSIDDLTTMLKYNLPLSTKTRNKFLESMKELFAKTYKENGLEEIDRVVRHFLDSCELYPNSLTVLTLLNKELIRDDQYKEIGDLLSFVVIDNYKQKVEGKTIIGVNLKSSNVSIEQRGFATYSLPMMWGASHTE